MKKTITGNDIYLQLEFSDFKEDYWINTKGGVFAYIDREGNVDCILGKHGVRFYVSWNKPHPPVPINISANGGKVYLELPEDVCTAVDREREKWFNHWAEKFFKVEKSKFCTSSESLTDSEVRTKTEKELDLVNFLLEPDKYPEPPDHEYINTSIPEISARQYRRILRMGRKYFWKKYRRYAECSNNLPPGGDFFNNVVTIAEGYVRYRDYLKTLLTEPGTTDSISEAQGDGAEDKMEKEIKAKTLAAIKKFEERCGSAFVLSSNVGLFCKLLEAYFIEEKTPNINTTFRVNTGNKGKIGTELYRVFLESGGGNLKAQSGLFQIVRSLSDFSEMTDEKIYQAIKRTPPTD